MLEAGYIYFKNHPELRKPFERLEQLFEAEK